MPKTGNDFPAHLSIDCTFDMKYRLMAWAYLRGNGGMISPTARDLLMDKILEAVAGLPEKQKADYEEILETVRAREMVKDNKKAPT